MGITIHYEGGIKDIKLIPLLVHEFEDIAKSHGWIYRIIEEPPFRGIALDIHPQAETFLLTFGKEGRLGMYFDAAGKQASLFVKTQYAGVETHVVIIKLLEYLKNKYIPDLKVFDEGEYWETKDVNRLKENLDFLQAKIDGFAKALDAHNRGQEIDPYYADILKEIDGLIKSEKSSNRGGKLDIIEEEERLKTEWAKPITADDILTEEGWEEFFEENEKLMDKYEKVYQEDPEREWRHPYDLYMKVHYALDFGKDFSFADLKDDEDEITDESRLLDAAHDEIDVSVIRAEREHEERMNPILGQAHEFSMAVLDFTKGFEEKEEIKDTLSKFTSTGLQAGAKIHGAHGMGYDMQGLEGNIATLKIALRNISLCLEAIVELKFKIGDFIEFTKIDQKALALKKEIEERIEELRSKVWWRA